MMNFKDFKKLKNLPIQKWMKYLFFATIIVLLNNWIKNKKKEKENKKNTFRNIMSLFFIFNICEYIPSLISNSIYNGIGYSLGSSIVTSLI